jgi:hypothetical protein
MALTPSRRTYDATLAELTSLEELMKTMMAEGQVHPDVIAKLWQAYGKPFIGYASYNADLGNLQEPTVRFREHSDGERSSSWECLLVQGEKS